MFDLLIRGGTLIDPSQSIHDKRDVAVADGKIAAIGKNLDTAQANEVIEASDKLVTPGLIDLHVHVFAGISHYGIEVDQSCLAKGVTTAVDAGSSGAQTFPGFRRYIIDVCDTRLFALLNISAMGMIYSGVGELEDIRYADVKRAIQVCEANKDVILGIKVRLTDNLVGENGPAALKRAREAADATGLAMMVHPNVATFPLKEILAEMKSGDILTHTFHGGSCGIVDEKGKILPEVRRAVERGVILDVGHGAGSFTFDVAQKALAQDILPDTISSDLHVYNINGPVFDLATTISKFLLLGLSLDDALRRATATPAKVIGYEDVLGTLKVGAVADIAIFAMAEGDFTFVDCRGEKRNGHQRLIPTKVIRAGKIIKQTAPVM